jgi:hypothetical protein
VGILVSKSAKSMQMCKSIRYAQANRTNHVPYVQVTIILLSIVMATNIEEWQTKAYKSKLVRHTPTQMFRASSSKNRSS